MKLIWHGMSSIVTRRVQRRKWERKRRDEKRQLPDNGRVQAIDPHDIESAASQFTVQGARYSEAAQRMMAENGSVSFRFLPPASPIAHGAWSHTLPAPGPMSSRVAIATPSAIAHDPGDSRDGSFGEKQAGFPSTCLRFQSGTSKAVIWMAKQELVIPPEQIERLILWVRGRKVILDANLAALFGTSTKNLNKAVKRNRDRFPDDFMFQLSDEEFTSLRFQSGTSIRRGGRRYAPYAFTEHGAIMVANLLNTPHAIEVSVFVVRAFVKLRELVSDHKELALKLAELERRVIGHDSTLGDLVVAIRQLMAPPPAAKRGKFGFARDQVQ